MRGVHVRRSARPAAAPGGARRRLYPLDAARQAARQAQGSSQQTRYQLRLHRGYDHTRLVDPSAEYS